MNIKHSVKECKFTYQVADKWFLRNEIFRRIRGTKCRGSVEKFHSEETIYQQRGRQIFIYVKIGSLMIVIYFYASYRISFSIDSIESAEIDNNQEQALIKIVHKTLCENPLVPLTTFVTLHIYAMSNMSIIKKAYEKENFLNTISSNFGCLILFVSNCLNTMDYLTRGTVSLLKIGFWSYCFSSCHIL